MFSSKKRPEQAQAIHTLLGKGTLWKGDVHAGQNSLRIEGTVEGTIHSEGEVTVAPGGEVRGVIVAKHLIVTGKVLGTFRILECLEIHGTGYVEGEVEVGSLVVDEGGTLQGTCLRRGMERLEKAEDKDKGREREREADKDRDREAPFVPFPTPPALPPAVLAPAAAAFAGANRPEDTAADRHVFNLANPSVPPLPAAGEHAYSKAKL
jgi:cytoskeletal protein CcmA (bactofilin family)